MTPEQWQRVRPILESALELDSAQRTTFLDEACAEPSLREEIESLIDAHEQSATDVLNRALVPSLGLEEELQFRIPPGKRIGPYEIIEEIATGGMGAVYRAVRADGQYKQQVALKIVRGDLGAELTAGRFRNERQILATLNHPNIAKILDGGTTADGLPYFAMEYIEGVPIIEYCDHHKLTIDTRLRLFRAVCSAVHYAHQRLVIHRDIKPSNILVTADGVPKLLDFGIAKILDPGLLPENVTMTAAGLWMMTPEYASPEQLRGEAITTATDVYSLGLVLYQLLTGHQAYRFSSRMPHEIARVVLETDPEKPSTAIRRNEADGQGEQQEGEPQLLKPERGSGLRSDSPEKLHRHLSGDLDNIVLKAIRKEPRERYLSVDQLSEDIRRHLENLPILARKSTLAYRSRKYVVRHRLGASVAALVFLFLLAGIALTLREARIARANEIRAEKRFNDVRNLANSLIFDVHDSIKDLPGSTPARKLIVERALQYLDSLSQESRDDLSLQRELAAAYERVGLVQGHYLQNSLGDTQGSLDSYRKALQIRQGISAKSSDWNDRLAFAGAQRLVANQQWAMGQYSDAVKNIASSIATSEALNVANPKNLKVLQELEVAYNMAYNIYGSDYAGRVGDSEKSKETSRKALAADEALLAITPNDADLLHAYAIDLSHFGGTFDDDPRAALKYYYKELEIEQKLYQHQRETRYARGIAHAYSHIGQTYDDIGDSRRSFENSAQGLKFSQEAVRADPKNTYFQQGLAIAYANNADSASKAGAKAQSIEYIGNALKIMNSLVVSAPENRPQRGNLAKMVRMKGFIFLKLGEPEAAMKEYGGALSMYESLYKIDPNGAKGLETDVASCKEKMGEAASRLGDSKLAEEYFRQVLNFVEPVLSTQRPDPAVMYLAADAYSGLGKLRLREALQSRDEPAKGRERWIQARSWYLKSLDVWHRIEHPRPNRFDAGDPGEVAKKLQLCEAKLSSSN